MDIPISPLEGQARTRHRAQRYLQFKMQPGDEAFLDQLSEGQRQLVTAEGSYQELAARFNLPLGTVRSRLHRARARITQLREGRSDDALPLN